MAASLVAVLALAATALGATIVPSRNEPLEFSNCGRVWVTVHSPEIKEAGHPTLVDALEVNWDFAGCSSVPQNIGIFQSRPTSWSEAVWYHSISEPEGFILTDLSLGAETLPGGWLSGPGTRGPHCLWPWVGAGDDQIQAYNCLKIQPTWMEDNAEKISSLRIGELAIPGAHNAGAWRFNTEISNLARDSFVLCQDRSIWAQLVHGIRYLDFRIGYYDFYQNEDDRYWLNHNLVRVRPIVPLLREIRIFLDTTKEVVFLDAHHFPMGFYDQKGSPLQHAHAGFLDIVKRELGPHLAFASDFATPAGTRGPTVQSLLDADKRLVFSYVDNSIVNQNNWLWPVLPHLWANTNSPTQLFQYLDQAITAHPQPNARSPLYSAMAQTTPTILDIVFLRGSLRENADAVNRNVTARLATRWRQHANIVSTDFFLGDDVIDLSIALSVERGSRL
ncbi:PI-PLC X domain-containing protein 1 isoform X2 [Plodia interpunctella]|uniref:PI-PLC X domain-containing protein 1 isoform X2 n=1 Tax=Plodia interpunctella TaxID=58824 RepID=UPI002367F780|nr:PI-PLC X domain-containing protein 1 isoform X2 [Plodia interpunctella]